MRWEVVLVDVEEEPGRVFGAIAVYRWKWLAHRRRRAEEKADRHLRQLSGAEWQVRRR